jgi:CcmD family protein
VKRTVLFLSALVLLVIVSPALAHAQGLQESGALGTQNLRGYTHMFIAYFIAWALVAGWVISIARRLKKLENALED